jgi:hypothetical protein
MIIALIILALLCALWTALRFPAAATVAWILVLETSPDSWLGNLGGGYEAIVGAMKAGGLALAAVLALRFGVKTDRYNPSFAYGAMFLTGLAHGLYPGLTLASSLRSLLGSAAPLAFGFVKLPPEICRAVMRGIIWGPLFAVVFGLVLAAAGLDRIYALEQGALRLGDAGQPPFLAGFALVAVYAGLMRVCAPVPPGRGNTALLLVNFLILLLTGARAPLAFAVVLGAGVLLAQRRIMALAAAGALASLALIFAGSLRFIRVVDLTQLGEATNLSNRQVIWPYFIQAITQSPWVGWGVGAGKVVVPLDAAAKLYIGTNAAHNEYLRIGTEGGFLGLALLAGLMALWVVHGSRCMPRGQRWLMRCIFLAFAVHSATDNTLIATTGSAFFIWASATFATAAHNARQAA